MEGDGENSEPDGLLPEGGEQEYFLELLMREVSPERPKASQPSESKDKFKSETASARGKEKKRNKRKEKKALEKGKAEKEASRQEKKERAVNQVSRPERQAAPDLVNNPEAKGRGLVDGNREKKEQVTGPQATSGGECSGQKTPDCS